MRTLAISAILAIAMNGQNFKGRPSVELSSDRLQVTLLQQGGSVASIVRKDSADHLNPLWDPTGVETAGVGHFLCLDAFGPTSKEEQAAGLQFHGEAIRTRFEVLPRVTRDGVSSLTLSATLPIVQERVIRNYQVKDGEDVLYVRTRVESLVGFDRPMVWAEHGTVGAPFLERDVTAVDMFPVRSETRPWTERGRRRLASGKEFTWPMAPLSDGGSVDLRKPPVDGDSGDHTTNLVDRSREYAFATVVNPKRHLIVGWVWRTADFPWLQNWENYPAKGMLARGLEFATQPFDISRKDAVALNGMFDAPTFRWLPAKTAIETSFAIFYAEVPEGFDRVKDVSIENGVITLEGPSALRVLLKASLGFESSPQIP